MNYFEYMNSKNPWIFLGLTATNRFWTFINVHFPKAPPRSVKNLGNMGCDHNALISVFL